MSTYIDETSNFPNSNEITHFIRTNLDHLCEKSTNIEVVLVHLFSQKLIQQNEKEEFEAASSSYNGFHKLYTLVLKKLQDRNSCKILITALEKSGNEHIVKILIKTSTSLLAMGSDGTTSDEGEDCNKPLTKTVRFNTREPTDSFIGRDRYLDDLHERIFITTNYTTNQSDTDTDTDARVSAKSTSTRTATSQISVITGLGGIGKTETVRKYIHKYGKFYKHIVWIDAEEHFTAETQFRKLAQDELLIPSKDYEQKPKEFQTLLKEVYENLCGNGDLVLVVFDNAETLDDDEDNGVGIVGIPDENNNSNTTDNTCNGNGSEKRSQYGIRCFLPQSLSLPPPVTYPVILVTSRNRDWNLQKVHKLDLWSEDECIAFILKQLSLEPTSENRKDAARLSTVFDRFPIALQSAVALIHQQWIAIGQELYGIQNLIADYKGGSREVLKKPPPYEPSKTAMIRLWNVTFSKIRQHDQGELALKVLNTVAYLLPTLIPKKLLRAIFHQEATTNYTEAVKLLTDYSLLEDWNSFFTIHRLIQDVTIEQSKKCRQSNTNGEMSHAHDHDRTKTLKNLSQALQNYIVSLQNKSSPEYNDAVDSVIHLTSYILARNLYKTERKFVEFIEFVTEEIKKARTVEAEKYLRILISYYSATEPDEGLSFIKTHKYRLQLVRILVLKGKFPQARQLCNDLLNEQEQNEGSDPGTGTGDILGTLHYMALVMDGQGHYDEALELYRQVIELRTNEYGPTDRRTLETQNNMAIAMEKRGQYTEAMEVNMEILKIREERLGGSHVDTITTKCNIAVILEKQGHYAKAIGMHQEVLQVRETKLGHSHNDTLITRNNMAVVLKKQGKYEDALEMYEAVLRVREKDQASDHPDTLIVKNNMAIVLEKLGKLDDAMTLLEELLQARVKVLGPTHNSTLTTKQIMAGVLRKQGRHKEAMKMYEEILELREHFLGHRNPSTLKTKNCIAWVHFETGKYSKAEDIAGQVMLLRETVLGTQHPDFKNSQELYEKSKLQNNGHFFVSSFVRKTMFHLIYSFIFIYFLYSYLSF